MHLHRIHSPFPRPTVIQTRLNGADRDQQSAQVTSALRLSEHSNLRPRVVSLP